MPSLPVAPVSYKSMYRGLPLDSSPFEEIQEMEICRVDVTSSPEPVHVDSKDFYVRLQNTTQQLGGQETLDYVERHWGR